MERTEFVICAENGEGMLFVNYAIQQDLDKAIKVYDDYRNSDKAKELQAVVTIQRHVIITKVYDFTDIADKMIKEME